MRLPNAERARVEPAKILNYLLSTRHEDGGSKAKFFVQYGFSWEQWQDFAHALRRHGQSYGVTQVIETSYGPKFVIEGAIETPDGRNPLVRTVWMINYGADAPRLITAYPLEA
jgi:hypothetical protein